MKRQILALLAIFALLLPSGAMADPADVSAAARGVVRVVIMGTDGQRIFPVSHGSGFAVTPTRIVTNSHVVMEAVQDNTLRIGIVPPDGDEGAYAKLIAVSPGNDLALLEIVGSNLRLPPLTVSGAGDQDGAEVSAVGYPMNVDQAQGLNMSDIFDSQPPVKSRGFLSGSRPSRQFDTILHTAPIARGNSGGPLLDSCGRVLGVNSFGADSQGGDAEFYFAVSTRELLPFLRDNGVTARTNALPCRSLAEVDENERERIEREQLVARQDLAERAEADRAKRERARLEAELAVTETRENQMAIAAVLLLIAVGGGVIAYQARGTAGQERKFAIASGIAAVALVAALAVWFTRPGLDEIDRRVAGVMQAGPDEGSDAAASDDDDPGAIDMSAQARGDGALTCVLQEDRSRIVGAPNEEVEFAWADNGCVNERTQYGFASGVWSRVFVPNEEAAVSVNRYDPASRTFRTDRYLLGRAAMDEARAARSAYTAPKCGSEGAASRLGDLQGAVTSALPAQPNERLVYSCEEKTQR
ncbi:S1C family serine protease [Allopontixanthobacter sediminis]|uniref:Trypsin-like serine protease n=1 Tax=Allopontixanthobacter sediminis TaxID=1689985 RepID=A0A845AZ73_9SPHN|nr:serine protease [Allopontixanthobacter sediminis]MXP43174.1 trypsin-like serine protease [Allopontixanthobacter sediminis]